MVNAMRIRYITSHFNVLKGLTIVPWGIYYLSGSIFALWPISSLNDAILFMILLTGLCLAGIAQWFIFTYYRRTFGSVAEPVQTGRMQTDMTTRRKQIWLWGGFALITVLASLLALWGTPLIAPRFSSIFIYRLLLAIALCFFCLALWLHERIEKGYGHIPVWPLAVYLLLTLEPPSFFRSGMTTALEDVIIGLLFIGAGIYNHLVLTRSLQPIAQEQV